MVLQHAAAGSPEAVSMPDQYSLPDRTQRKGKLCIVFGHLRISHILFMNEVPYELNPCSDDGRPVVELPG